MDNPYTDLPYGFWFLMEAEDFVPSHAKIANALNKIPIIRKNGKPILFGWRLIPYKEMS